MKKCFQKKYRWITLGTIAIIVRIIVGFSPAWVETIYSRGIFQGIRWLFDFTIALSPVPLFYLLVLLLIYGLVRFYRKNQLEWTRLDWRARWQSLGWQVANFFGFVVFSFMILWGFNYARVPIEEQITIHPNTLNLREIIEETTWATQRANALREQILNVDTAAINHIPLNEPLQPYMRCLLEQVLRQYNYPTGGRVRGRQIYPKGFLMRMGIAGIYLPWIGEGHADGGLHVLQLPFTLAHEMAHGYGFGDEGTCNFLAYLACQASDNPAIQYAGQLTYWRYIASEYKLFRPTEFAFFRSNQLSRGMHNDLAAIYANREQYPEWFPYQDQFNDLYLKFQGIEDGIENYNRMVSLVRAWRLKVTY